MPRYCATKSIVSSDSQPFSSCAMTSALITAEDLRSAGYLAISRSILFKESALNMAKSGTDHVFSDKRWRSSPCSRKTWSVPDFSPVDFPEDDVLRSYDCHGVGDHVPAR